MNLVMLTIVALYMICCSHAQLALCLSVLFFSTWYAVHLVVTYQVERYWVLVNNVM